MLLDILNFLFQIDKTFYFGYDKKEKTSFLQCNRDFVDLAINPNALTREIATKQDIKDIFYVDLNKSLFDVSLPIGPMEQLLYGSAKIKYKEDTFVFHSTIPENDQFLDLLMYAFKHLKQPWKICKKISHPWRSYASLNSKDLFWDFIYLGNQITLEFRIMLKDLEPSLNRLMKLIQFIEESEAEDLKNMPKEPEEDLN